MLNHFDSLTRYIACARVTQRPIFEFISTDIRPNDKVMVFAFDDDYTFGVIQSDIHWQWFLAKCTTLAETPNYNSASIWDTFPWPQSPKEDNVKKVSIISKELRDLRNKIIEETQLTLRDIYRQLELPGNNPLKEIHKELNNAVLECYGFKKNFDILQQLLDLNYLISEKEKSGDFIQPPGLPEYIGEPENYTSTDCINMIT